MRIINITWEIDDGYTGGSRPQEIKVDELDIGMSWKEWDELSEADREDIVFEIVDEDFNNKVSFYIKNVQDNK